MPSDAWDLYQGAWRVRPLYSSSDLEDFWRTAATRKCDLLLWTMGWVQVMLLEGVHHIVQYSISADSSGRLSQLDEAYNGA